MDLIFSILPILILIYLMVKKHPLPSHIALPVSAFLFLLIKLLYFKTSAVIASAAVINGLLTAWTPILIIWGAIFLFMFMEHSGHMSTIRKWLNSITTNRVAQLMIIGWAFSFLIEGASGFGTPAALAAPLLVGMGFSPVRVAMVCLIMNSVPVTFGVVGVPTWFGLGQVGLTHQEMMETAFKSGILHTCAAMVVPVLALKTMVSFREIRENLFFIYISIISCVLPMLLISRLNYEFPSLTGGLIGLLISVFAAKKNIGLKRGGEIPADSPETVPVSHLVRAGFPIWGTVLLLILTRIKHLGLNSLLTSTSHALDIPLGIIGDFSVSSSLVVSLKNILGTESVWSHKLLYIPSLLPFFAIVFLAAIFLRPQTGTVKTAWSASLSRMMNPIKALLGALVFVKLLMAGNESSCAMIIGNSMAAGFGRTWQFFAAYLGAVGSFFAGSNTVSNLTFGGIQDAIAQSLGLNRTTILSLQSVGGAMGNMVCINNIVAVCSVLGLTNVEGAILKRTVIPMLVYGIIVGVIGFFI